MLDIFDRYTDTWWKDQIEYWGCLTEQFDFEVNMKEWYNAIQTS